MTDVDVESRQVKIVERHRDVSQPFSNVLLIELPWVCPRCGGPRGEPEVGLAYTGSQRMQVHEWANPCGHVDMYENLLAEVEVRGRVIAKRSVF